MYCAYVTTIKNIRKHSNADRLQCCEVFGNNVIVDLSYSEGQRVVYFPTDGQLGKEFAEDNNLVRVKDENGNYTGGYLDPDKRNIKAIKLRGEKSEGLILPVSVLAKYTNIEKLKDGDTINTLNGYEICRKYIPRGSHRKISSDVRVAKNKKELKQKVSYPYFEEHIDTEQLAYNEKAFKLNDIIYLTRKLHGSSMRVSNSIEITTKKTNKILKRLFNVKDKEIKKYNLVSGSRRVVLRDFDGGFYGSNAFRKKYHDYFMDKLPKGMTVYGEIVGWIDDNTPIMPKCNNSKVKDKQFRKQYGEETIFTYGCPKGENHLYIYRITMTNEDGIVIELPTEETKKWAERLGCDFVPILEKFLYTTWEDLNNRCEKYLDIPEPLSNGTHVTEGVVVRIDNRSKFTAYKTKSFAFKVLEGIIKESAEAPDIEEAQEIIDDTKE